MQGVNNRGPKKWVSNKSILFLNVKKRKDT